MESEKRPCEEWIKHIEAGCIECQEAIEDLWKRFYQNKAAAEYYKQKCGF